MATRKQGEFYYGDTQKDLHEVLMRYSKANAYLIDHFADAVCVCGNATFFLLLDENEGAAKRICIACKDEHFIGDSADYAEDAELEECECPCGKGEFEVAAGVALYQGSEDVKWFYIGCRCVACGLVACYGDWKNEYEDYRGLLKRI